MNAPNHIQARYAKHLATLATFSLGILAQQVSAADVTWLGNTSNLWNTGANWSTSAIPTSGSTLIFGTPGSIGSTGSAGIALSDDIASLTVGGVGTNGIEFNSSSGIYTVTRPVAQTITLGSSAGGIAVKNTSLFLQTLSVPMTSSTDQTVQVGNLTGAALSSLTTGTGAWTGGFRLTKTGTGLLTLGNSNVLSGLTINQGTVSISSDAQLSTAPVSTTAGWIVLNGGTLRMSTNTSFELNANRGIALGDGTAGSGGTLNVFNTGGSGAFTLTYNGVIANNGGTNSLTKTGVKILSLGGANTYTGATKINQGQITLDFTASGAPTSNIINSSSNLVMGGIPNSLVNTSAGSPILYVQGSNTGTTSQTFNGTSIQLGNASIVAGGGSSTFDTTLNLGALTHTAGGTVGFSTTTNGSSGKGIINTSTTATATNGILGGWATTAASTGTGTAPLTQTDWATVDGSGNIVAYTGYTVLSGATPAIVSNAASNVRITNGSTGNPILSAGTTDVNTIQSTDTNNRTITTGSGNTLRLGKFGGIWTASTGTLTVGASTGAGGTLTAGGATDTAGEIVFTSGAGITVNSVIADNGTGVVNVVKTGAGSLTLNAANSFSGGMIVNQGSVTATNAGAFGGINRDVTVMPGASIALATAGGLTYANNFNLAGSALTMGGAGGAVITTVGNTISGTVTLLGDTTIGSSGTNGTISGKITGDYSLSIIGGLTISGTNNDYTGNLGINGTAGALGGNPVTVKLGANEVLSNGAGKGNVIISGSGTFNTGGANLTILDLNGKTETINGLVSVDTAQTVVSSPGITVGNARVTNSNATASTLILGDNNQTAAFNGTVLDGAGSIALTKIGSGRQTLGGANAYTGATTINGGALRVDFTAVGGSATNTPSNYISSAALNLGGGTLEVLGRANGGTLASTGWTGTLTSPVITVASTAGLVVGQALTGTNLPSGAYITYLTGTTITLNNVPTATSGNVAASATSVSTSQSFANTTLNAGASGVSVNANGGNGTVVNLNAITRNNGSTLAITLPTGTQSATNGVTTTSTTSLNNNVLASTAGGTAFATVGGNDWASLSGNNIVGLSTGAGYTTTASAGTTAANYTNGNIDVTSSEGLLSGVITPNTFRFNTAAANTVTLAAGNNVIGAGGILVTSAVGNNLSTITGGNLMGSTIGKDLVVIQNNVGNGLTIASNIVNNGTATTLTKSGAGLLTLSGTNTYTGSTYVNAGTLTLASGSSTLFAITDASSTQFLGTGAVNFNGSFSFDLSGVSISSGSWTLVDVANLSETFGLTSITSTGGLTFTNVSGIWTSNNNAWSFNQATGILTVSSVPEPATYAAIFGSLVLGVSVLRRRRSNHNA